MKVKRVACLLIFFFLFLFGGSSMGADKVDEASLLAMGKPRFLECNAFMGNMRAETLFFDGTYNEPILMKELKIYASVRKSRQITKQEVGLARGKLLKELKKTYGSDRYKKLVYLNQKSVECGGESKQIAAKQLSPKERLAAEKAEKERLAAEKAAIERRAAEQVAMSQERSSALEKLSEMQQECGQCWMKCPKSGRPAVQCKKACRERQPSRKWKNACQCASVFLGKIRLYDIETAQNWYAKGGVIPKLMDLPQITCKK